MSLRGTLAWLLLLLSIVGCNEILGLSEGSCFASCGDAFDQCLEGFCPNTAEMFCGFEVFEPYDHLVGCACGNCVADHKCEDVECGGEREMSDACKSCVNQWVDRPECHDQRADCDQPGR